MGNVYSKAGHTVAIKVIDLHKLTDRVLQDMLMSEISSLRALKGSPNILQLEEVYSTRNNIYIITEMCESGDLVKLIEGRPRT
jgi:serine/threonine-protein kinase ULK/ATG1